MILIEIPTDKIRCPRDLWRGRGRLRGERQGGLLRLRVEGRLWRGGLVPHGAQRSGERRRVEPEGAGHDGERVR